MGDTATVDGTDGVLNFGNLGAGSYILKETQAPTGYAPIVAGQEPTWNVTIHEGGLIKVEETATGSNIFKNFWNWLTGCLLYTSRCV